MSDSITGCGYHPLKYALSWVLWPALFVTCMAVTAYGFKIEQPIIFFNIAYIFLIISLFFLDLIMKEQTVG